MLGSETMAPGFPIGISDFRKLREGGHVYVDKSQLICDLIDRDNVEVFLLPRPRRFGKTLNLTMLRCFFERSDEDLAPLFDGLAVWRAGAHYRAHFQRYPVIYLTFKGTKRDRFEDAWAALRELITKLYDEHRELLDADTLSASETVAYHQILDRTAPPELYHDALGDLVRHLARYHGEKVVVLIDEYDEPLHAAYLGGYAKPMLDFLRAFLSGALKDQAHLHKAVLTGILRVARESIFSGLNNLAVYSLLHVELASCFGFTEAEVDALLAQAGRSEQRAVVQHWYNGYDFGGEVIYNPWSVLSFLSDPSGHPGPHWLTTSANRLIKHVLEARAARLQPVFEALLDGERIERVIDPHVVLDALDRDDDAVWALLVFSGYLRASARSRGAMEQPAHELSIPNREVRLLYSGTFAAWMKARLIGHGGDLDLLTAALFRGDAEGVESQLQTFMDSMASYFDTARPSLEHFYHGFVLGLLAVLEPDYQVRSNRESGRGRPDLLIRPTRPGRPGVVLELKVARPGKKTLAQALREGRDQIESNAYAAELTAAGADPIHAYAVAFDGTEVRVEAAAVAP
ncbi:AAA family ATPase [Haliangium sp.]|uniref:AAA family ATPase n=1 Tax=Haliangium sp. TaxID=2663208 RepID=UPI003D0E4FC6